MFLVLPLGPEQDDLLEEAAVTRPYVTGLLALVCLVVFVAATMPCDNEGALRLNLAWGYSPERPFGTGAFFYQFMHGDFWHLFGNLIFLIPFGTLVECKAGHLAALLVYLVAGFGGAWLHGLTTTPLAGMFLHLKADFYPPLVGASGSIMGLVGATVPVSPNTNIRMLVGLGRFWRVVPVPAWIVGGLFLAKEVVLGLMEPRGQAGGTAYMCHVGGILSGAAIGFLVLPYARKLEVDYYDRSGGAAPLKKPGEKPAPLPPQPKRPKPAKAPAPPPAPPPVEAAPEPEPPAPPPPVFAGPPTRPAEPEPIEPGARPIRKLDDGGGSDPDILVKPPKVDLPAQPPTAELPVEPVPENQDVGNVTGAWAFSWKLADLQDKLNRARKLERDPAKVASVARFYNKVLTNPKLPAGHRVWAGARLCRVLLRFGEARQAALISGKLLSHPLPDAMRAHIQATHDKAVEILNRGPRPTS